MKKCNKRISALFFSEYLLDNTTYPDKGLGFSSKLHVRTLTKELTATYLQAFQTLPEPMQTLHIRYFVSIYIEVKEVFAECGLDFHSYKNLEYSLLSPAFHDTFIHKLSNIDSSEELRLLLPNASTHVLRALAAGVIVSPELTLKPKISVGEIREVFEESDLNFENFNEPIDIDDYLHQCKRHVSS
ncbi:hypothetical protein PHSC3_001749 [Chlamydiales bacterium STE3]|nr:hypothetical protein PHSC3_001749 [Chlamydiales bacterium STE3]